MIFPARPGANRATTGRGPVERVLKSGDRCRQARTKPLLPVASGSGKRWCDQRRMINGIWWKVRTCAGWRDVPERFGP
ncbi:transposase [Actinomadura luteofluorescens]|uniref:transposase n=1 Tax=Actinomadura luteofluorescens TaxID=46163 RepID=UPI0015C7AC54